MKQAKLKGAKTNLQRVKDIMKQLNNQINSLKKQADKLKLIDQSQMKSPNSRELFYF